MVKEAEAAEAAHKGLAQETPNTPPEAEGQERVAQKDAE
jgi:hypothetical protein